MISLGVPPSVSTNTGMYMILWSTMASTVMYLSYGNLNMTIGLWLSLWCCLGILIGVALIDHLIKMTGRQSILVFFLVGMLGLSMALVALDLVVASMSSDPKVTAMLWESGNMCD